jgi:ubiquinone/menaquinone biosynthesis C-methylase UbiE
MIGPGRRACNPNIAWVRGNGFQLPFAKGFDFVFSFRFVRHFRYRDRARLYREIVRVLKSGGWFMMDAVNARVSEPLRRARPEEYPIFDELYEPQQLLDELASAGLEPVSLVPVQKWYTWQYRSQTLLGPRSAWLNRFVIRGLEMLPRADGLEWIVTCRRP